MNSGRLAPILDNIQTRLRNQDAKYRARLPIGTDPNEWVEYLLGGVRQSTVRLLKLEPQILKKLGPYEIVVIRIDSLTLQPTRSADSDLTLGLTVLGVMG